MQKYLTRWLDYKLPTGQEFSVAVCGYSGKVRHMYLGNDPVRRMIAQHVYAEEGFCQIGDHCLALDRMRDIYSGRSPGSQSGAQQALRDQKYKPAVQRV